MLTPGQHVELSVEKPAAGGRMIARHEGQVVFVLGAIPGERVVARIDKAERQLAFATTIEIVEPSPDRREPFVDPLCGGCLYAHVTYAGQLRIKGDILQDAFGRLGRIALPRVEVAPSPEHAYRMRGRLHVQGTQVGFYREGTHTVCDAASTAQMNPEAVTSAVGAVQMLQATGTAVVSVQSSENIAGDQRALHVELQPGTHLDGQLLHGIVRAHALTGCSARSGTSTIEAGEPSVVDPLTSLTSGRATVGILARRAESFFQANRYLLPQLVGCVLDSIPAEGEVLDLYAGVGLFSMALASAGRTGIIAVEGDRSSGTDLRQNAAQFPDAVQAMPGSVERYLSGPERKEPNVVIVDPPRTGISKAAMQAVAALGADRVVYVSCDPPTMARDARRLLDAGYELDRLSGFDLFPNTPHVESLGVFTRIHHG